MVAPGRSNDPTEFSPLTDGNSRVVRARAPSTIGTLTQKTHLQLNSVVRTPPMISPAAPPLPLTAPQTPRALLRSFPSSKITMSRPRAAGAAMAAPAPWTKREATRDPNDGAMPAENDAAPKSAVPRKNNLRRPNRSPSRPPRRSRPPKVRT